MEITTTAGNTYSFLPKSNEIVLGTRKDTGFEWMYNPLKKFNDMPNVGMFIIGVTEQCNLRCHYCCYSGEYIGKRSHRNHSISKDNVEQIIDYIDCISGKKHKRIAFYGGEPLLHFEIIQYCVDKCRQRWGENVSFSISTNGTLLNEEIIDWLIKEEIEIALSLDGTKLFHDRNRVFPNGKGSYDSIKESLNYIYDNYKNPNVTFHMTLSNVRDLIKIAKGWHEDELLGNLPPTMVHGLSPNFALRVEQVDYEDVKTFYYNLIDAYELHPDWLVLKVFFEEAISAWKERLIFEIDGNIEVSTCMPINTKLYIDSNLDVAVCEKFSDSFRIGNVMNGIDWNKTNGLVKTYYDSKVKRCSHCPIVRMCEICLTSLEYTPEQMKVLCHNEQIYARVSMYTFCEMAERGLIS